MSDPTEPEIGAIVTVTVAGTISAQGAYAGRCPAGRHQVDTGSAIRSGTLIGRHPATPATAQS